VRFHIIGAGVAGLAAALAAVELGHQVSLYEAAPQAGGRCRSLDDPKLGRRIDNGSHVLLGANPLALDYLDRIGARQTLVAVGVAGYPFVDLATGERWAFRPGHRVPGIGIGQHLRSLRLVLPAGERTVAQVLGDGPMVRRLWSPLFLAALNTAPQEASAALLRRSAAQILRHGRAGLDLMMARRGLSETFVDPALVRLRDAGTDVHHGHRLAGLLTDGATVGGLEFGARSVTLNGSDRVILAIGPAAAAGLVPGLTVPTGANAIVNGHFLVDPAILAPASVPVMGLCGATAHWLFQRGDVLSATVSAANDLAGQNADAIAQRLWEDIRMALDLGDVALPPFRVVKEKRATFAQTPANECRRPGPVCSLANLFLAGDWTDTGLPASLESAVCSGRRAISTACGA
jgi:squalene-associated FAD-dependent desaturase